MKVIMAYGPALRTRLREVIADERAKPEPVGSWRADFFKRLLPYATAGKLIRGNLVCFSYRAFASREPDSSVTDVAVALELVHSGLLIHDDIMDHDDVRRGRPSLHRQYQAFGERAGLAMPENFGANMAICGADMCMFLALRLLAGSPAPATELFGDMLAEVCDGQMRDIYTQACPDPPTKKAIYSMMRAKTASYTLSLPLALGAALADQPTPVINKLIRIGNAAGTIFQIRDDELGVMGDTRKTGKPVGADIREGKKSLVYHYLMKRCGPHERHRLKAVFGDPATGPEDVALVQELFRRHDVTRLLADDIRRLENQALRALGPLDLPRKQKDEIRSLIDFCAKRQA